MITVNINTGLLTEKEKDPWIKWYRNVVINMLSELDYGDPIEIKKQRLVFVGLTNLTTIHVIHNLPGDALLNEEKGLPVPTWFPDQEHAGHIAVYIAPKEVTDQTVLSLVQKAHSGISPPRRVFMFSDIP